MFTRVVSFSGATDIDAGVRYLRDSVAPLLHEQKGFRGVMASADRVGRQLAVLSLWETEAERDASESTLLSAREEGPRVVGGEITVENYEELLAETARPPVVGSALFLLRTSMDPAQVDEIFGFFGEDVLQQMKATSGFQAVRYMINRQTGEGRTGSIWSDEASMIGWAKVTAGRRRLERQRGVTFAGVSEREIVFVDLR
jgi:heme-degrading monooxygenase HmoA